MNDRFGEMMPRVRTATMGAERIKADPAAGQVLVGREAVEYGKADQHQLADCQLLPHVR